MMHPAPRNPVLQPFYPASEDDAESEEDMDQFIVSDNASESGDDDSETASSSESDDHRKKKYKGKRSGNGRKQGRGSSPLRYLKRRVKTKVGKRWREGKVRW